MGATEHPEEEIEIYYKSPDEMIQKEQNSACIFTQQVQSKVRKTLEVKDWLISVTNTE